MKKLLALFSRNPISGSFLVIFTLAILAIWICVVDETVEYFIAGFFSIVWIVGIAISINLKRPR
jgi:hypothetical protein